MRTPGDRAELGESRAPPAHPRRGGRPLPDGTRRQMEGRLGGDFSGVRVHTGAAAARAAGHYGAVAYTLGSDVVFAPGRYTPETPAGDRLLAHELKHVIQQRGAPRPERPEVLAPDHPSEREARGERPLSRLHRQAVQRQVAPEKQPAAETGTGGRLTAGLLLSGQTTSLFMGQFMQGVTDQLVVEEVTTRRGSRAIEHIAEMQTNPLDALKLYAGFNWGYAQGLVSPIVDIFSLIKLGYELQMKFEAWLISQGLSMLSPQRRGALSKDLADFTIKTALLGLEVNAAIEYAKGHPLDTLSRLGSLTDQALIQGLGKAHELGRDAADEILKFLELPAFDFGEKIGYVAGMVTIEIVLLVATDAIANLVWKAIKAVEGLGLVGRNVVRVITMIQEAYEALAGLVKTAGKWLAAQFRKLFAALGEVLQAGSKLLRSVAEGIEEAGSRALAAEGPGLGQVFAMGGEEAGELGGKVAGRGPGSKAMEGFVPEKVHPLNKPKPDIPLEGPKPKQLSDVPPEIHKEVEEAFKPIESRGKPAGTEKMKKPVASKIKINFKEVVDDAMASLKKQGVSGLGPREYGTKLHAEIAAELERRLGHPPTDWVIGVDQKLSSFMKIPDEYADLTVKEFLERTGKLDPTGKIPSPEFAGLEQGVLNTKLSDLKPDLVIGPPGEPLQTWDWVADFNPSHHTKSSLYGYIASFTEEGAGRFGRVAELYYKASPKRLAELLVNTSHEGPRYVRLLETLGNDPRLARLVADGELTAVEELLADALGKDPKIIERLAALAESDPALGKQLAAMVGLGAP